MNCNALRHRLETVRSFINWALGDVSPRLIFTAVEHDGIITRGNIMDTTLRINEHCIVTAALVDDNGAAARITGALTWAVEGDLLTLEPAADGLSCRVIAGTETGAARVTVTGESAEVNVSGTETPVTLTATLDVTVEGVAALPWATQIVLTVGPAEPN